WHSGVFAGSGVAISTGIVAVGAFVGSGMNAPVAGSSASKVVIVVSMNSSMSVLGTLAGTPNLSNSSVGVCGIAAPDRPATALRYGSAPNWTAGITTLWVWNVYAIATLAGAFVPSALNIWAICLRM